MKLRKVLINAFFLLSIELAVEAREESITSTQISLGAWLTMFGVLLNLADPVKAIGLENIVHEHFRDSSKQRAIKKV